MTKVNKEGREKLGQRALREENHGTRRTKKSSMMTRREPITGQGVIQKIQINQMTDIEIQAGVGIQTQEANKGTTEIMTRTIDEETVGRDQEVNKQTVGSQAGAEDPLCIKKVVTGAVPITMKQLTARVSVIMTDQNAYIVITCTKRQNVLFM